MERTILCIDDNAENRYVRKRILNAAGYRVIEAADGAGALKMAAEAQPALVVLDIRLPDLNGFEVCQRLKSDPATEHIPVLHVSAMGRLETDLPAALEHHSDAYLREPIEPETLVSTVGALIRGSEYRFRYRNLLERTFEGVWIVDAAGRTAFANPRMAAMLKYEGPAQLAGRSLCEFIVDGGSTSIEALFGGQRQELRLRCADGSIIWASVSGATTREGRMALFTDITALRESEARYRQLFESIDEGFCVIEVLFDADGRPCDFVFVETNAAFEREAGLTNAAGKRALELIPNLDAHWFEIYGRIARTGLPERFQETTESRGTHYDLYAFRIGEPEQRRVAVLFRDITGRERQEAHQAVLTDISEELSRLSSTDEMMRVAGERIGAHLKVSSCLFAEIEEAEDRVTVIGLWNASPTQPEIRGAYRLSGYADGGVLETMRAGRTAVVRDTRDDPRTHGESCAALGSGAFVSVPFRREKEWKYLFSVNDAGARDWRADEIEFIEQAASRIFPRMERARTEEALRLSIHRYEWQARLFEGVASTTPDFVYLLDRQGRFLYANRRLLEVWGMEIQDVIGKTCLELGYERWHHDMHMREIAQVIETKATIKGEVPFRAPLTGIYGIYEYIFTPVLDGQGEVEIIAGTTRDVTERKQGEEALRSSEERFRALVMATSDMVYRMSADWSELRSLSGRGLIADSAGPSRDWLQRFIHPEERQRVMEAVQTAIWEKRPFELEHRVLYADGTVGWVFSRAIPLRNEKGEITEWFGVATDATARKEAEAALQASEARERARSAELSAILDAAPVALFVSQDRECRQMEGSRTAYEMLRLDPGVNVSMSAPEGERPATFRATREGQEIPPQELPAQRAAATGEAVRNYEFDLVYADGACRHLLGDAVPLFDEQGRPRGAVGAFVDITERKRNEERLRQTQKLESIGLLAGGIAHDFNNLLTGILGNASLVADEVGPGPAVRLQEVIKAAERAAHLTRQLLAYSGKGQFYVQDLNVGQAVQEITELVQFSIPVSAQLAVSAEKRLPPVRMDPGQMQQILMNLVINAGEAIGEGNPGRITVSTALSEVEQEFVDATGRGVEAGRYISVEVSDTGCGIGRDDLPRIFDPFFTTKFTGRGLGLAAVAGILRAQNGGITVESAPGEGSTFRVFLRVESGIAEAPLESGPEETMLVVEDERSVRDFIGAVLQRDGYRVLTAADGQEALDLCDREKGRITAAVVDIVMPRMGALELLEAVKGRQPEMKILLTSGYNETEARRLYSGLPKAAFIQKPYTAQQLSHAVEQLLERDVTGRQ